MKPKTWITGWTKIHGNLRYGGAQVWGLNKQSLDDYHPAPSEEKPAEDSAGRRKKTASKAGTSGAAAVAMSAVGAAPQELIR